MAFLGPMASIIPNFGEETGQKTPEYLDPVALMVAISSTQSEKLTGNGSGHEISHDMYISNDVAGSVIGKFRSNCNYKAVMETLNDKWIPAFLSWITN